MHGMREMSRDRSEASAQLIGNTTLLEWFFWNEVDI